MVLCNTRVPVVGNDGTPLMPTKASRARRWSNGEHKEETDATENAGEGKSDVITEQDQKTGWRPVKNLKWSLNSLS